MNGYQFRVLAGELIGVGIPVVYACRLASAPAGQTLVNQGAYERLLEGGGLTVELEETSIDVKNEGKLLAYRLAPEAVTSATPPDWFTLPSEDGDQ